MTTVELRGRTLRATLVGGAPAYWPKRSLAVVQTPVSIFEINLLVHSTKSFLSEAADLIQSAVATSRVARAQAFDARLNKQPAPNPPALHTTAGLTTARANNTPTGENKVFITVECRIKSNLKREQNSTDSDCGRWGKPWLKEDYLTGNASIPVSRAI